MKKNININLFGTIYNIDEDAYELLQDYLNNLRSYFGKQEGGEEIADDIEHRIAELFWERKQLGVEAIDVMTVKTILNKLGKPEQMTEEGEEQESDRQTDSQSSDAGNTAESHTEKTASEAGPRKLYRDTKDKQLGGVLSGLCHYFGGTDPLPWRILFVILNVIMMVSDIHFFSYSMGLFFVFLYLLLWMIVPEAQNSEERLRMQGKKITPESIKEEVIKEQEKREPKNNESGVRSTANGCLSFVITMFKIGAILIGVAIFIPVIFALIVFLFGLLAVGSTAAAWSPFVETGDVSGWWIFGLIVCGLTVLILPIYGLLRLLFSKQPRKTSVTLLLIAIWVCALGALYPIAKQTGMHLKDHVHFTWNSSNKHSSFYSDDLEIIERNDAVEPFKQVVFDGIGELNLIQADSCAFFGSGISEILDNTTVSVRDSILYIKTHSTDDYGLSELGSVTFDVQLPVLEKIQLNGVGSVTLKDTFRQTETMTLSLNGVGGLKANQIVCPSVIIENQGVGKSEIHVDAEEITASNNGVGVIELSGRTQRYNYSKSVVGYVNDEHLVVGNK